ncbi:MAG: hypothetical protein QM270_07925 [Bacillota bacterium]|nr:hypothetical protein [Bacillota bacterium]
MIDAKRFDQDRFTVRVLDETADGRALAPLFHAEAFPGQIELAYLRDPDPIRSWAAEGVALRVFVLSETASPEHVLGCGTCVVREVWVGGERRRVGYLAGLKLLPEWRGRIRFIAALYRWMIETTRPLVDLWYTTILSENEAALRLLARPRPSIPLYVHQGRYRVHLLPAGAGRRLLPGRRSELPAGWTLVTRNEACVAAAALAAGRDLADVAFPPGGLFALMDAPGRPAACLHVVDQRALKQYRVLRYNGAAAWLQNVPAPLMRGLGLPPFPEPGSTVPLLSGALLLDRNTVLHADVANAILTRLLEAASNFAAGCGATMLGIGAMEDSPEDRLLAGRRGIRYTSELFLVDPERDAGRLLQDPWLHVAWL